MAEDQKIDFEPIDFQEEKPSSEESIQFEPIDFQEEAPAEPVDIAKEEATGYNMDKFLSDTGDVLGRVASIPGDIYQAGKFAIEQAPQELEKIQQDPAGALKAAALAPTLSQNLSALVEKGIAKLDPTLSSEAYQDLYGNRDIKDIAEQNRAMQEKVTADFPLTSMGSKMLTTTALAAPAIAAAPAALAAAAPTVAYGTLGGIEAGEKKLNETGSLGEGLREGVKTLATQGVADAATMGLARAAKSGLQSLKKVPASQTLKSIGATSDEIAALEKSASFRPDKSPESIAKQLEESGVVRAMRSKEGAASKLADAITTESTKLDDVVKNVSNKVNPEFMGTMVDDIARTAEEQILKKLAVESGIVDPDHPVVKDIQRKLQELRNVGEENILTNRKNPTFEQIHNKKKEFGEAVRTWEAGRSDVHQKALRDLYGIVNEGLDMMVQSTDVGDAYKSQNSKLAKLFAAKKLADPKGDPKLLAETSSGLGLGGMASRTMRKYGPAGIAGAAATGLIGLPATVAALPAAYGVAKYGRSVVAAGARGAEKTLNFGAQNAAKALESAKMRFPEVYNKFAAVIENAAKRGDAAVSATNYMLSQQFPEYREMIENSKDEEGLPVELTDEEFE